MEKTKALSVAFLLSGLMSSNLNAQIYPDIALHNTADTPSPFTLKLNETSKLDLKLAGNEPLLRHSFSNTTADNLLSATPSRGIYLMDDDRGRLRWHGPKVTFRKNF